MKKITFMNVPLCTGEGNFVCREITLDHARYLCSQAVEFGSAVGHSGAAEKISELLRVNCPVNRVEYVQPVGEKVISIKIPRQPEGIGNLFSEFMDSMSIRWYLLERMA